MSTDSLHQPSTLGDLIALAREQRDAGRLGDAEATSRLALECGRDQSEPHRILGTILHRLDRVDEAVESLGEAVRIDPGNVKALREMAVALAEQGRVADAIAADRETLRLLPRDPSALYHLSLLKTYSHRDPDLLSLEASVADDAGLTEDEVGLLHFALAKAYEDIGDYDASFRCLQKANALRRSTIDYDVADDVGLLRQVAAVFRNSLFDETPPVASSSNLPILIIGMPRSGTTLVEQILASHPAVYGAGEVDCLDQIRRMIPLFNERRLAFPDGVPELGSEDLVRLGEGYAERLRMRAPPDALRVTDKHPMNFVSLGLVRLIVPDAHIIHCTRDPKDTCLSCYKVNFESVKFAFDLEELGSLYRAYVEMMDHWRSVLPRDWILEVRYEDLVEDIDRQARRIVAHCDLTWDDGCLAFHSTRRSVRTASFVQVRRPVYRDAVGRWRRYESHLAPLFEALGAHGTT